jgi:tetratricopeptide (TPR) repeat protein
MMSDPHTGTGVRADDIDGAGGGSRAMNAAQLVTGEEAAATRAALDRLLASETFRGSPQLAAFLRFVVETTLRGESARLKGYTIGVEALGRSDDFDPQSDPIVRVEATRLRRTLERYYAGPGAADPIVFEMTRGSYVPAIRRREDSEFDPAALAMRPGTPDARRALLRSRVVLVPLAALALVGVIAGTVIALRYGTVPERRAASPVPNADFEAPLRSGDGMPTLVVQAPEILRGRALNDTAGSALIDKMRATFARFDTINLVIEEPGAASDAAKPAASIDYRLVSTGEYHTDGTATARFRLIDSDDDRVIWSRSFERVAALGTGETEDMIVRLLAMTLLQPFGVIRSNERRKHLAGRVAGLRNRCIIEASESFRSFEPAQHARARMCLERLTERDPGFALGFAYLAAVYTRGYQYHGDAGGTDLLDRALRVARRAVELSPETARTYQMLATVLFARHDLPGAFAAAERAIALNPYDMTIQSDYGGRLVASGEVDRGMAILNRAAEEGAVRPSWYQFYMFLGSYLKNDMVTAAHHAGLITTESFPLGLLGKALIAAADGNRELAQKNYDQLVALRAGWRDAPRDELNRLFPSTVVVDRLARDLANSGLAPKRP